MNETAFAFTSNPIRGNLDSMSLFPVSFDKEDQLLRRMAKLGL